MTPTPRDFRRLGFADPAAARRNVLALTPTPREAELFARAWPRLAAELAASPDPDMALNNLERHAAVVDRSVLFLTLAEHPGAAALLARVLGASQFLADALRRRPSNLAWLLEPATMRVWLLEDLAADLAQALLGDADLAVTTEELARLADVCLAEALRAADAAARAAYGPPLGGDGGETGLAVIAMGKLGGEELNYSSDVDLMFVYGADGETAGGRDGCLANGDYFTRVCKELVAVLEEVTDEGYAFRVDLRLRPEGRMGALILSLDRYRDYYAERCGSARPS